MIISHSKKFIFLRTIYELLLIKADTIKKAMISLYEGAMKTFSQIPFPLNILAVAGALAFGNSQISFGNVGGFATVYVGSASDPVDAIDDITPSAYEEANGSGSGTYNDIGLNTAQMGIGAKFDLPYLGAVNYKYYPKTDGTKNADNSASGQTSGGEAKGSGSSLSIKTDIKKNSIFI